jgi:hypothetical protein
MRTLSSPVLYRAALSVLAGLLSIPTVAQSSIGSGPAFVTPWAIAVEATSTLVVVDSGLHWRPAAAWWSRMQALRR